MKVNRMFLFLVLLSMTITSIINDNNHLIKELSLNEIIFFNTSELIQYEINISSSPPEQKYLYIEVNGTYNNTNYILSVEDNNERIQLAQSKIGRTILILSRIK